MEDQINDILYYARVLSAYLGHPRNKEAQEVAIILIKKLEKLKGDIR
jgi:hypothetical protein